MEIIGYLITGAASAAIIKLLDNLLQWHLARKAKKEDKAEEKAKKEKTDADIRIEELTRKLDVIASGQKYLLLDRIRYLGLSYLKVGEISLENRRLLGLMYDVYHNDLGGNGDLDALMNDVYKLPIESLKTYKDEE